MKKGAWLVVAALALLLGAASRGVGGFIVALAVVGVPYLAVCYLSPRTRHTGWRTCKGSGEVRSRIFPWAYRRCRSCNGTGRQIRAGARVVGQDHVKAEYQAVKASKKRRKKDRAWR